MNRRRRNKRNIIRIILGDLVSEKDHETGKFKAREHLETKPPPSSQGGGLTQSNEIPGNNLPLNTAFQHPPHDPNGDFVNQNKDIFNSSSLEEISFSDSTNIYSNNQPFITEEYYFETNDSYLYFENSYVEDNSPFNDEYI